MQSTASAQTLAKRKRTRLFRKGFIRRSCRRCQTSLLLDLASSGVQPAAPKRQVTVKLHRETSTRKPVVTQKTSCYKGNRHRVANITKRKQNFVLNKHSPMGKKNETRAAFVLKRKHLSFSASKRKVLAFRQTPKRVQLSSCSRLADAQSSKKGQICSIWAFLNPPIMLSLKNYLCDSKKIKMLYCECVRVQLHNAGPLHSALLFLH